MMNRSRNQKKLIVAAKILRDNLPEFAKPGRMINNDLDVSNVTDAECVNLLESFLTFYKTRITRRIQAGSESATNATKTRKSRRNASKQHIPVEETPVMSRNQADMDTSSITGLMEESQPQNPLAVSEVSDEIEEGIEEGSISPSL